jgi:hypothetical protein
MQALDTSIRVCPRERSNTTLMRFTAFGKRSAMSVLVVNHGDAFCS